MKLIIPGELPTANDVIGALNVEKRFLYGRMKRENTHLVSLLSRNLTKVKKADFEFTWHCKDRRKDKDNIMFGQKFIFDGLVKAKVIENDGWAQIGDITHKFKVDKENPRVEILIKEV